MGTFFANIILVQVAASTRDLCGYNSSGQASMSSLYLFG